jgi:hypothetical protein
VSAEISTAPASAVPIDAPRFVNVFCRPPTSPVCSSGTDETVTLPSCEARQPMPRPASSIGHVTISGPAPMSSAIITAMPAKKSRNLIRTTRRGGGGKNGTPTAATSSVIERGSRRTRWLWPRARAPPIGTGAREEHAGLQQVLEEEATGRTEDGDLERPVRSAPTRPVDPR